MPAKTTEKPELQAFPTRLKRAVRIGLALAFSVLLAGGVVYGLVWVQEEPLRAAEAALQRGAGPEAMRFVESYLAEHPDNGRAISLRARILVQMGQPAEAIALFQKSGAESAADLQSWARAHMQLQQWSMALPILARVLELEPQNADAWYELTSCRTRLGQYREALQSAGAFAALPGNEARGHLFLGSLHNDLRNESQALREFELVLQFEPAAENLQISPAEFFREYGRTLLAEGKPQEAREQLERSVKLRPTADGYVYLGNAWLQAGKPEAATEAWKKALRLMPAMREAREALANAALEEGNAQEAHRWLEVLERNPGVTASTAYLLQRVYTLKKDETQAERWKKAASELRTRERLLVLGENIQREMPDSPWANVIRAHGFARAGNWLEAEGLLAPLVARQTKEPFVLELWAAIRSRGELPALEKIPFHQH